MMVSLENQSAFINMAKFVYTPFAFDMFLHSGYEFETTEVHEKDQVTLNNTTPNLPRGGQHSIVKKFLSIIDTTTEFVKQHGYVAQQRTAVDLGFNFRGCAMNRIHEYK